MFNISKCITTVSFLILTYSLCAQNPLELSNINSAGDPSVTQFFKLSNGHYVFSAQDVNHGREPWVSDGTSAGTFLLKDIEAGSTSSITSPMYFPRATTLDSLLFFNVGDYLTGEIWITDGTAAGTKKLLDTCQRVCTSSICRPIIKGGEKRL